MTRKYIVVVNNRLFLKSRTPARACPINETARFGESIDEAHRFATKREAQYFAATKWPGERRIVEVNF